MQKTICLIQEVHTHGDMSLLEVVFWLVRVDVGDSGELRDDFVDSWVVRHGARTQRIETSVDTKIPLRQPRVVPHHFGL